MLRVLGPVELWRNDALVPVGGAKQRLLLAVLLAHRGEVVSVDRLCDALWGERSPASAVATLQSQISRLRRCLEPELDLASRAPGYLLDAPSGVVDASRFEELVRVSGAADATFSTATGGAGPPFRLRTAPPDHSGSPDR
ncbi:MAG TPA: winged helix-turn-helix domain-containing protein [Acidimicrobiales bacterium]|nr:winged helix-turn-helix domain-containing protein [Acidimicrobiales bacterium]